MNNVSLIDGHIDEPNMTDEQIIVLVNKNAKYSSQYKMIADLINRLKAEIELAKMDIESLSNERKALEEMVAEQKYSEKSKNCTESNEKVWFIV